MSEELPGALQAAVNTKKQVWPHTMDAQVWAEKWMTHVTENPSIATDEGCMLGWFANAIMAGYDTAQMRAAKEPPRPWLRAEEVREEGHYWFRDDKGASDIMFVMQRRIYGKVQFVSVYAQLDDDDLVCPLSDYRGEWQGPLKPELPKEES